MDVKGMKITIVGAARSGLAAADLALALGGIPRITEARPLAAIDTDLGDLSDRSRVVLETGGHTREFIQDSDLVVASPGVKKDAEALSWARDKGIPVMSEIEFAWRSCTKPVIAVTGSNGKTTTSTLIAEVLRAAGRRVCLCGNVGTPFSRHVLSPETDFFVVEVSSFQLELIETFRPHIAVLTNFSQNHLDRHPDMQDYFEAKARLFMNQTPLDFALVNDRDPWARRAAAHTRAKVVFFNREDQFRNPNHLAAAEVAKALGIDETLALRVCDAFPGVEHRMERVREIDGVEYINDSKATTAESGAWALTRVAGPVIMICGGHDKGEIDLAGLRDLVAAKVRTMIVLTREEPVRAKLHAAFEGWVALEDHTDMGAALSSAKQQARRGDKVLLSPMFASFDMFKNFEHRGKVFKELVNAL